METKKLLQLYRKARMVDGHCGRTWDAIEFGKLDSLIEKAENRRKELQDRLTASFIEMTYEDYLARREFLSNQIKELRKADGQNSST